MKIYLVRSMNLLPVTTFSVEAMSNAQLEVTTLLITEFVM